MATAKLATSATRVAMDALGSTVSAAANAREASLVTSIIAQSVKASNVATAAVVKTATRQKTTALAAESVTSMTGTPLVAQAVLPMNLPLMLNFKERISETKSSH